jgi:hypothetical protein
LKEDLANNYLLGSNQYPDTFEKALRILGNSQGPKNIRRFRGNHVGGVAFIQRGRGTGRTSGQEKGPGRRGATGDGSVAGNNALSTSGSSSAKGVKTNSKEELHCYNYGEPDHWAHDCPQLTAEQQQQLHMNLEYAEGTEEQQEEAHQLMHVTLA